MFHRHGLLILFLLFAAFTAYPQSDSLVLDNQQIITPAFLPTHPLGVFSLRLTEDFRMAPPKAPLFNFSYSSGNCWAPPVTAYIPTQNHDVERMRSMPWHVRQFEFNPETAKHEQITYAADGVFREVRLDLSFKVDKEHEVGIISRGYYLTAGEVPTSLLTSDQFIEWFHTSIYKDHDPFARRVYGFNHAGVMFQDREGRQLSFSKGAFFVPATELRHVYYPQWLNLENFVLKAASHIGINHHRYNSSLDGGLSIAAIKQFSFSRTRSLHIGLSPGVVRRQWMASEKNVQMIEDKTGFILQGLFRYNWLSKNKSMSSISLGFHNQSAYYTNDQSYDYWVLSGERHTSHWAVTMHHLFRNLQAWTLAYQYTRKYTLTCYIQEDLLVNNGPDIQVGVSIGVPLAKNNP